MIRAQGIHKRFGTVEVLKGVSLDVGKGEVLAIIGPSGSGKSTFLRCLNHLETIDRGGIEIEGETLVTAGADRRSHYAPDAEIRRICRKMGMVFQHFNLFPHLTVLENVIEAPLTVKGLSRQQGNTASRGLAAQGRLARAARELSVAALGRPEAARGDCPGAGDGAGHHAFRRADVGA